MRIWVDLTNSPHVLVMRPARAEDVRVVKRDGPGAGAERVRRDPELFCHLLVGGLVRADRG